MELDPFARRILDLTREARAPSEHDKRRVDHALSVSLGLAAVSSAGTAAGATAVGSAAAKSTTMALLFKWTAGAAVLASAVTASYFEFRSPDAPEQRAATAAVMQKPVAPQPADVPAGTPPTSSQQQATEVPATAVDEQRAATDGGAKTAQRRAVVGEKSRSSATLAEELDLLHEAQAQWRNRDPGAALSSLARHRQLYPKSALGPEREALRVLSLCAAGRTQEAKVVARRSFPEGSRSPFRAAVDESCIKD